MTQLADYPKIRNRSNPHIKNNFRGAPTIKHIFFAVAEETEDEYKTNFKSTRFESKIE